MKYVDIYTDICNMNILIPITSPWQMVRINMFSIRKYHNYKSSVTHNKLLEF